MLSYVILFLLANRNTIDGNPIPNCQSFTINQINGNSKYECKECKEGYAIDENKLCNKCDSSAGYIQDTTQADFTCKKITCTDGEDHCQSCSTGTSCSVCDEGYMLTGSTGYKNCLKCALGYEQSSTSTEFKCVRITCSAGKRHCAECKDDYECNQCDKGYESTSQQYIDCDSCMEGYNRKAVGSGFQCTPNCPDINCARCDEPNQCAQCKDDYFLDIRGSCLIKCDGKIDNCIRCITTLQNEIQCESCDGGYDITKDYKCGKIPYQCLHGVPETQICTNCKDGFYLKSDSCHPCPEELHCTSCSLKDGSSTEVICDECDYFYFLSDGLCISCPDNCEECDKIDGTLQCTSCDSGYYLSNGACIKCGDHCTWCNYEDEKATCTRCESGYSLNNEGICSPCSEDLKCSECNLASTSISNSNYCEYCMDGFILSKDTNKCVSCNIEFCQSCSYSKDDSSTLYCNECENGYYVPSNGKNCIPCPAEKNCLRCEQSRTNPDDVLCIICKEGFYEPENFVCEACPENCLSCYPNKNDFICTKCDEFSELKDNKCQLKPCDTKEMSHCSKCRIDSDQNKECILCDSEYYEISEDKLSCKPIHIYYIQIQNNIADPDYSLYAKNGNDYIEIVKGTPFQANKEMEFSIEVYLTSKQCKDYTLVNTIKSSLSDSDIAIITNSEIPTNCINPSTYEVCVDLSSFSNDYAFGYSLSYEEENQIHTTLNGKLDIQYNHQFSLSLYLTKSPKCNSDELLNKYVGSITPKCLELTLNDIPDQCKIDTPNNLTYEPTPISTPEPTNIQTPPRKEEILENIEITGETTEDDLSSILTQKFGSPNDDNDNSIKIVQINSDSNVIQFKHDLDDNQLIKVDAEKEIHYNGGKLNLALINEGVDVLINNDQPNIKLYGSGQINIKLPDTDKENIDLDIQGKSDVNGSVSINVPNSVSSLIMDTIHLESECNIAVHNENKEPVSLTVNTIEATANSITKLSNVKIKESIKVVQSAYFDVQKVDFDEKAKIEYQIYNYYNLFGFMTGNLGNPPKNIVLRKSVVGNERPDKSCTISIIEGTFEKGNCEKWGKSIDFSDSGFNHYTCRKRSNAKTLEEKTEILTIEIADKSSNGNKNLGMIIGIVVGCVVVVAIVVVVVVIVIIKKRKKSNSSNGENNDNNFDTAI